MDKLFESGKIKHIQLKNKIVRSATWEGMCNNATGAPTDQLIQYYKKLAEGGTGLIISGYTYVMKQGQQTPGQMGIQDDSLEKEHKQLTKAVHQSGGKIFIQLVHCGGFANPNLSGSQPKAPSQLNIYKSEVEELTLQEIRDIIEAFVVAGKRAKDWGYDGIQLHAAHGYLINQFLSPYTNIRKDEYGGNSENRSRFLNEIYRETRHVLGTKYPIIIKLNGEDHVPDGITINEAVCISQNLDTHGIDGIEVSSGSALSGKKHPMQSKIDKPEDEGYNLDLAVQIKDKVKCPVISVGGFRSLDVMNNALKKIDYIALSRPLIKEPDLPNKFKNGKSDKAECINCNKCSRYGLTGGIKCVS